MANKAVKYYVVDAFTDSAFKGNPAAVCFLQEERDDRWLQAVAAEFNVSQTCYLTRIITDQYAISNPRFRLRWFTPVTEVNLCGHATLAAAHCLFTVVLKNSTMIEFETLSGILTAKKLPETKPTDFLNEGFFIELNFPSVPTTEFNSTEIASISEALSLNPVSIIDTRATASNDILVVLQSGNSVAELVPQIDKIEKFPGRGIIATGIASPDSKFDFISRFFCPKWGINEDPVCGSAHCALAPYWSEKLGKVDLVAYQASSRSGILNIHLDEPNQRVLLRGKARYQMDHPQAAVPQVCTLKMNVRCEACRRWVKKQLGRIHGVNSFDIDANAGSVTILSIVDPLVLVEKLAKAGKKAELLWVSKPEVNNMRQESRQGKDVEGEVDGIDESSMRLIMQLQELANNKGLRQLEVASGSRKIKMIFKDHVENASQVPDQNPVVGGADIANGENAASGGGSSESGGETKAAALCDDGGADSVCQVEAQLFGKETTNIPPMSGYGSHGKPSPNNCGISSADDALYADVNCGDEFKTCSIM